MNKYNKKEDAKAFAKKEKEKLPGLQNEKLLQ